MAQTGQLTRAERAAGPMLGPVTRLRIAIVVTIVVTWEAVAYSGLLFRDVVPSLMVIGRALVELLAHPDLKWPIDIGAGDLRFAADLWVPAFYWHLYVTIATMSAMRNNVTGLTSGAAAMGLAVRFPVAAIARSVR